MNVGRQHAIQLPERLDRGTAAGSDLAQIGPAYRHQQRAGHSLPRHIRHGQRESGGGQRKEIVQVAAHALRRRVPRIEDEPGQGRGPVRQQHLLDAARDR